MDARLVVIALVICALQVHLSTARGPPIISGNVKHQQIVRAGQTVKLPCPVEADPAPLLQWTKDREAIHSGWIRFRRQHNGLRIKDIELEDAGEYNCKATNGFGSVDIEYTLYVLPDTNDTSAAPPIELMPEYLDQNPYRSGTPPRFMNAENMKKQIQRPVGSSVRFRCKASGHPRPLVRWYKDGSPLADFQNKQVHWTFKLRDLEPEDGGDYMCKVFNTAGSINHTFTLTVIEKIQQPPELIPPHPLNSTIYAGGRAAFHCRVRSIVQPHIKWLKRVESENDMRNTNTTIVVKGQKFVVLKTGQVAPSKDGSYLNKLYIDPATVHDSGMYICLGANTKGYKFRSAFLTVLPDPNQKVRPRPSKSNNRNMMSGLSLPFIIAIPALVIVIIVGIVIYIILRRRQRAGAKKPQGPLVQRPHHHIPPSANPRAGPLPCTQPMLPPMMEKDIYKPVTSPAPSMQYPIHGIQTHGASRERILKNYGDVQQPYPHYSDKSHMSDMPYPMYSDMHSDISSPSVPMHYTHVHKHGGF